VFTLLILHYHQYIATLNNEVTIDCDKDQSLEDIASLMVIAPNWVLDSNLPANGYECSFYQKD